MNLDPICTGDTARQFTDTLTQGGSAINLAGGSVVLVWKNKHTGATNRRAATIVSAAAGTVSYQAVAGDVDTPGIFLLQWEVTISGTGTVSIPTTPYELPVIADAG